MNPLWEKLTFNFTLPNILNKYVSEDTLKQKTITDLISCLEELFPWDINNNRKNAHRIFNSIENCKTGKVTETISSLIDTIKDSYNENKQKELGEVLSK